MLTQKSQSLFGAMGWRTVAEIFASRVVFLVAHLLTGEVWFSVGPRWCSPPRCWCGGRSSGCSSVRLGGAALPAPFYLSGQVVGLGIAATLLGLPPIAVCVYLSWRILRVTA